MVVRAGITKFCDQRLKLFLLAVALIIVKVPIFLIFKVIFDLHLLDSDPTASASGLASASSSGATSPSATSARGTSRSA